MAANIVLRLVEVVVIQDLQTFKLKVINDCDKSTFNGHKTIKLNLNSVAVLDEITCATNDLSLLVSLNLNRCQLSNLPEAFKMLRLKELNLSFNSFKEVPNCVINGLRLLEILDLSQNQLTYFDEPQCVKKLCVLRINNNKFENIPKWILTINAFNLQDLYYSFNDMTSLIGSKFLQTPSYELRKLELRNCSLRSTDVMHLKGIKLLNYLDLSNDHLKATVNCFSSFDGFSALFHAPRWNDNLKVLQLNRLCISDLPEEVSQLVVLEELHLKHNELMWLPDSFSLNNLRLLDISFNKMVHIPKNLSNMCKLQILRLAHNVISNVPIDCPPQLEELDLYTNCLDSDCDITIKSIAKVDLEQNYFNTSSLHNYEKYVEMKNSLRMGVEQPRNDGPLESLYEQEEPVSDPDGSDDDSSDCVSNIIEDRFEESWSSDCSDESCHNGCTLSDNEWMGYEEKPEKPRIKHKKNAHIRYPSWSFEDVDL